MSRKRQGPARWTLPLIVNPTDSVCFQIQVPNDPFHVAAFLGAIYDLAKPYKWQNDAGHTAIQVGAVWFKIFEELRRNNCERSPAGGVELDEMARIRVDPDNPCILQQECLPDQWVTLFDVSECIQANPGQPSPAGPGPGPGETEQYCLKLSGNGKVILPIAVQGDYSLELVNKQGGWTDGGGNWNCPNGQSFILGLCSGVGGFNGGDPLPTALHASIVAEIDTLFYDGNSTITVPSGLVDQQVVFQMNDASLSDNYGDISFCVKVTAPTPLPIELTYAFGTGPASVNSGNIITITSGDNAGNQRFDFNVSECCKVEFLSESGWVTSGSSGSPFYADCSGNPHNHVDPDVAPSVFLHNVDALQLIANGAGGTHFTCQVRITRL